MNIVVCIPARLGSTRFPEKVLAKDTGKYLVQHVWEKACQAKLPQKVIIATDNQMVVDAAKSFGAEAVLTSPDLQSGTDRVAAAVKNLDVNIVINLQGDEPEIEPSSIDALANLMLKNPNCEMGTLTAPFQTKEQIADPAIVKVVVTKQGQALYFSRSVIPYNRAEAGIGPVSNYLRHLGIYAYKKDFLLKITELLPSMLEKSESLEQLRVLENGYKILVGVVERASSGIDTADQYADFVKRYKKN